MKQVAATLVSSASSCLDSQEDYNRWTKPDFILSNWQWQAQEPPNPKNIANRRLSRLGIGPFLGG